MQQRRRDRELRGHSAAVGGMNRQCFIVLCPPRSFSSVVGAALGQHPDLHAFAELNLFTCDTLGDLLSLDADEALRTGVELTHLSGLIRAVAHLDETVRLASPHEVFRVARDWLEQRAGWTTGEMLDYLLARIAPRCGLDKSPRTALSRSHIERALALCPSARFIHLARHPVTTAQSLLCTPRSLIGGVAPDSAQTAGFGAASFALHLWLDTHHRLLALANRVPPQRLLRVRGEAVLADPARGLGEIAGWLNLPVDAAAVSAMLRPQDSPYANTALWPPGGDNDIGFLQDPRLRAVEPAPPLEIPREWGVDPWLADEVLRLGRQLGYGAD